MGVIENDIIAQSLIAAFLFVLVVAVGLLLVVFQWRRMRALATSVTPLEAGIARHRAPSREAAQFGLKRSHSWLAVKGSNVRAVQSALALHNATPCTWAEGLRGESDHRLFISPPVSGWILIIGPALPDPSDDVDAAYRFICDLSRKLGHVQFFHVNGVLDHHAWVRAESGKILRAYAWAGKTLWNQGPASPAETVLGMKCLAYGESAEPGLFTPAEPEPLNSEKVHLLAARWSLDPADIDSRFVGRESGVVGEVTGFF